MIWEKSKNQFCFIFNLSFGVQYEYKFMKIKWISCACQCTEHGHRLKLVY